MANNKIGPYTVEEWEEIQKYKNADLGETYIDGPEIDDMQLQRILDELAPREAYRSETWNPPQPPMPRTARDVVEGGSAPRDAYQQMTDQEVRRLQGNYPAPKGPFRTQEENAALTQRPVSSGAPVNTMSSDWEKLKELLQKFRK